MTEGNDTAVTDSMLKQHKPVHLVSEQNTAAGHGNAGVCTVGFKPTQTCGTLFTYLLLPHVYKILV